MKVTAQRYFVGVDVGTSGIRACAIDAAGTLAGEAQAGLPSPEGEGSHSQQDPGIWRDVFHRVMSDLLGRIPADRVQSLAVDGTSGTVLLVDEHGQPLTPALMYNDARATAEAGRIAELAPRESGAFGATSGLAKALFLIDQHRPRGRWRIVTQADWLAGQLTGHFDQSDENNTLKLGFDPVTRRWPNWLAELGVDTHRLPEVRPAGTLLAGIAPTIGRELGLPDTARMVAGTTDSVAATLATGIDTPGQAVTSLGSTLALKILSPRPVFAPEYGVYSHRVGEQWLAGGASNSGGAVLGQFFSRDQLTKLSERIDPATPSGLDYYPLPAPGERFPVSDPALEPRLTPRPEDDARFLQGLLEGIARIEKAGYQRLAELGAPYPDRVLSVGGGARNAVWRRIRQDLLGVPVTTASQTEAAFGAALLARRPFAGTTA